MTLSVLGGYKDGQLVGPAFAASFILAKTEDTTSETPVEEDNWAAAAEWAESLGVDVISSSLGYLDFDSPFTSYGFADMNGDTAISTRAADVAASLGVVVVNSAGNSGFDSVQHPGRARRRGWRDHGRGRGRRGEPRVLQLRRPQRRRPHQARRRRAGRVREGGQPHLPERVRLRQRDLLLLSADRVPELSVVAARRSAFTSVLRASGGARSALWMRA
jgi:hypothetical protein